MRPIDPLSLRELCKLTAVLCRCQIDGIQASAKDEAPYLLRRLIAACLDATDEDPMSVKVDGPPCAVCDRPYSEVKDNCTTACDEFGRITAVVCKRCSPNPDHAH